MSFYYRRSSSPVPSLSSAGSSSSSSSSSSSGSDDGDMTSLLDPRSLPQQIPDLRFEQSYLASIRGFVHELEPAEAEDEKARAKHDAEAADQAIVKAKGPKGEPELWIGRLRIDWLPLLQTTIRDQFLSPLVQGAMWGIIGMFAAQFRNSTKAYFQELRLRRMARNASTSAATGTPMASNATAHVGLRASQMVAGTNTA